MNDAALQDARLETLLHPLRRPATKAYGQGVLAAPAISRPAAKALKGLNLEFREICALPIAKEAAAQLQLVFQEGPVR